MRSPLSFGVLFLICQWRPSSMDVDSKSKWVDKKNDDRCPQQSENEKHCLSEREELRQRVILLEALLGQLNASKEREEKLTNALQHLSNKLDSVEMGSKQSFKEGDGVEPKPLPWTLHQSWDPPWSFLMDTNRLEMYTFDKNNRFARRETTKDRGNLPLFVKPGLDVGKVHEASFRILRLCEDWYCNTDGLAVGVNAGIDLGGPKKDQILWTATNVVIRSLDGRVYENYKEHYTITDMLSYVGRPLLKLDVVTVQVDLTREVPRVKFAVNGKFGQHYDILYLPDEKIKQLRFVVETYTKDVTVEII